MMISQIPPRFEAVSQSTYKSEDGLVALPVDESLCQVLRKDDGEIRIAFLVVPKTLRNYQNIFQTSDGNKGIRIEIDETGGVGLIVADTSTGFLAAGAERKVSPNVENQVRVTLTRSRGVSISVNDSDKSVTKGEASPMCDRFLIGAGFDETRIFSGSVQAEITVGLRRDIPLQNISRIVAQILLFGGFLLWATRSTEPNSEIT